MYSKAGRIDFGEFPTILWDDKYEDDPECLDALVQHISDFMLFGYGSMSAQKKQDDLLDDIFTGKTKKLNDMYKEVLYTYGAVGSSTLKDYKFFHTNFQSISGMLIKMPFKISAHNVSQAIVDEKIGKGAKLAAAMIRNKAAAAITEEDGQDVSFMENKEEYIPSTIDELLSSMSAPQQEEYALTRILTNLEHRHKVSNELLEANRDHFVCGKMFAYIDYMDGEPVIKHVPREKFGFISPVNVRDMDDPNIIAWGVKSYISLENALRKYGHELASSGGVDYLKKTVNELRSDGVSKKFRYNPTKYQSNSYASMTHLGDDSSPLSGVYDMGEDGGLYRPHFYHTDRSGVFGYNCSILEHKVWFKVIKSIRAKLLIDGKNPSKKQVSDWKRNRGVLDKKSIRYEPIESGYKANAGEYIISYPKEELWEAIRLGHCTIINVRKYKYQTRYEKEINRVKAPVVGVISNEVSAVELGKELSVFYNSFMLKAAELRNIAGADDILLLDKAQMNMGELASMLHSGQHTGTAWFDSTTVQDKSNPYAAKHLTKTSLTPKVESIVRYFEAAQVIKSLYDTMVGKLGEPSPYDSAQKVNQMLQQSSLITQKYFQEDYLFRVKAIQRWADIVKAVYGDEDKYVSVFWKQGEQEILKVTKELSSYDYEIYFDTGIKAIEDRNYILARAEQAVSAGALGFIDMIKIYFSDNIQESVAKIQIAMDQLKKDTLAQQESQQAIMAQKNEIDTQKMQVPLQVKEMDLQGVKYVADLRYQNQSDSLEHKANASDIQAQNKREEAMLQANVQSEAQASQQEAEMDRVVVGAELNKSEPSPPKK